MAGPETTSTSGALPVGRTLVGKTGIIAIAAYLILLSILLLYVLIKVWPRSTPSGPPPVHSEETSTPSSTSAPVPSAAEKNEPSKTAGTPQSPTGTPVSAAATEPVQISLFWGSWKPWLWSETRLLLIVILAGAFGSLVHAIRSFYWYVGNRDLKWSWALTYVLLPFGGGILAMLFYFVVRGGFFSSQSTIDATSPFAFAAFSGLVGMFSSQAVEKLKQIAGTVFAPAQQGKDHVGPVTPPKIDSISPASGPAAGATPIAINGSNFLAGCTVSIGGVPASATSVTPTSITATTAPHAVGKVDVEVTNPDNHKATLPGGFTYI